MSTERLCIAYDGSDLMADVTPVGIFVSDGNSVVVPSVRVDDLRNAITDESVAVTSEIVEVFRLAYIDCFRRHVETLKASGEF